MGYVCSNPEKAAQLIKQFSLLFEYNTVHIDLTKSPFHLTIRFDHIASFTLTEQPNCCGILVSTNTWVAPQHQGYGIAQSMMPLKEALAREFGYSMLIATVNITGNPKEQHILTKFGWNKSFEFVNNRTGNLVGLFFKDLTK